MVATAAHIAKSSGKPRSGVRVLIVISVKMNANSPTQMLRRLGNLRLSRTRTEEHLGQVVAVMAVDAVIMD